MPSGLAAMEVTGKPDHVDILNIMTNYERVRLERALVKRHGLSAYKKSYQ